MANALDFRRPHLLRNDVEYEAALGERGMERSDITDIMGGKSRVSEFFAGKRDLSLKQVKALREVLGIPADLLIPAVS